MYKNNKKLRAIVLDESVDSALEFRRLCSEHTVNDLEFADIFLSYTSARRNLIEQPVDVVFVNSDSKPDEVMNWVKDLMRDVSAAFVMYGSNLQTAIQTLRSKVTDYLPMPLHEDELISCLERVRNNRRHEKDSFDIASDRFLILNRHEKVLFLEIDQVMRLEAHGSYSEIIMENGSKFSSTKNIHFYENLLVERGFFKAHRSHLVNISKIKEMLKEEGDGILVLKDGVKIAMSRVRKNEFLKLMMKKYL